LYFEVTDPVSTTGMLKTAVLQTKQGIAKSHPEASKHMSSYDTLRKW
jgi:hypothetical protein